MGRTLFGNPIFRTIPRAWPWIPLAGAMSRTRTNNRIQVFENNHPVAIIGSLGIGDGLFSEPFGAVVDSSGSVYVADSDNDRIEKFVPYDFGTTLTSTPTPDSHKKQQRLRPHPPPRPLGRLRQPGPGPPQYRAPTHHRHPFTDVHPQSHADLDSNLDQDSDAHFDSHMDSDQDQHLHAQPDLLHHQDVSPTARR